MTKNRPKSAKSGKFSEKMGFLRELPSKWPILTKNGQFRGFFRSGADFPGPGSIFGAGPPKFGPPRANLLQYSHMGGDKIRPKKCTFFTFSCGFDYFLDPQKIAFFGPRKPTFRRKSGKIAKKCTFFTFSCGFDYFLGSKNRIFPGFSGFGGSNLGVRGGF